MKEVKLENFFKVDRKIPFLAILVDDFGYQTWMFCRGKFSGLITLEMSYFIQTLYAYVCVLGISENL